MKALSTNTVRIEETSGELSFVVDHQNGWIDSLATPVILAAVIWLSWRDHAWWLVAIAAMSLAWLGYRFFKAPAGRSRSGLVVNDQELLVTLDLIDHPNRVLRFRPSEVNSLQYLVGAEHQPSGLYLNDTCVFNGLDRKQAEAIVARIFYRFPGIGSKDETPASVLHGDSSGVTTLDLSATSRPANSAK